MAEVKLSSYSGSVSGGDWTPALEAARAAIASTGGRILVDVQTVKLMSAFSCSIGEPVAIEGDGSNRVWLANSTANLITIANNPHFKMRGLVFTGDNTSGAGSNKDCANGLSFSSNLNVTIEHCLFGGIKADSVFKITSGNIFKIADCDISGNGGASIDAQGIDSFELVNTSFIDYLTVLGAYRSKVADGAGWLLITNPPAGVVGARRTLVKIANCRFDEASAEAIHIEDYQHVIIEQPRINVGSYGYAIGINLQGVEHAIIRQPHAGYNNADRPIIQATNCRFVDVIGCGKDADPAAPFRITKDAGTVLKNLQAQEDIEVVTI